MPDGEPIGQGPVPLSSLTNCGTEDPVATEWAKYLVQAVGHDVMSFRRNTRVSYMVLERARDAVKAINGYIDNVDKNGDYTSFTKYTEAIDPLEAILLNLHPVTETERDEHLASTTTINDCITSVSRWVSNREGLSNALKGFNTCDELKELFHDAKPGENERRDAQIDDDKVLLKEMRDSISTSKDSIEARAAGPLHYIITAANSLNTLQDTVISASRDGWWMDTTIRTSMLVGGVLKMVEIQGLETAILNHLKSMLVWNAASELIAALTAQTETLAVEKYEAFLRVLTQTSEIDLPTYIELLKAAGKIRRPFQAQAFALTNLCCDLGAEFAKSEKKALITVENVGDLQAAYTKALKVLQTAADAAEKLKTFELEHFDANSTVQEFKAAHGLIENIFKSPDLKLEDKWNTKKDNLAKAFKRDEDRMKELNARFKKSSIPTSAKITVKVSIYEKLQGGTVLRSVSVEEERSTRLVALRWNVAGAPGLGEEQTKRARDIGTLYKMPVPADAGDKPLDLHLTLGDIAGSESDPNMSLRLLIAEVPQN